MANSERIIGLEPDGSVPVTIVSGGGTGGTASSFGAAFPPTGTAAGFISNTGTMAGGTLDSSGNLLVNVAAGSGSNPAAGATGSAVPASADYQGVNVGGTLRGATAVNPSGSVYAQQIDLASVAGATTLTGHGTATGAIRVELPTDGTGVLATVGAVTTITNAVTVSQGTASNLKAQVTGAGTAGSADTGVQTIQGIASMTPVQVSQATAASLNATVVGTGTFAVQAAQSGTWTVQPGNTPNSTPWLVTTGHGKTIKSLTGSFTADTDIIAAVTSKRIKAIGYAFFTFGTSATTIILKSNGTGGTALWTIALQAITPSVMGANMAVSAPSFIFATAAGEKLTADTNTSDMVYWSISYFDDDAT